MTEIIDNTNKLSTDPHDLGEFKNVYDAMKKYPNGGRTGDYITILSVKHYWNEENLSWGILEDFDENIIQMIEDMLNKLAVDGYAPNWLVFVFKQSEEQPNRPTGTEKYPVGWLAQAGSGDSWWFSTGLIRGATGEVISWSEPVRFTGKPANEGVLVFKQWPTQPEIPTSTGVLPDGWETGPTSSGGLWWMSKGDYDGIKKVVTRWSVPVRVTGIDGNNPTWYVFVFKQSDTQPSIPTGVLTTPTGWVDNPTSEGVWWMSKGTVDGYTNRVVSWSTPVKCTGEDGTDGEYIDFKYAIGSMTVAPSYTPNSVNPGSNWFDAPPTPTTTNPGLWMIQAKRLANGNLDGTWSAPVRINGEDGQDGQNGGQGPVGPPGPTGPEGTPGVNGAKGQVVYPAGIYSTSVNYTTDANKAPYVLDSSNNTYYVLNKQITWLGTSQGNKTPYQDYSTNGVNASWIPFTGFEAVFTKLLMAQNGLIGSAVFNGDYMFSQIGTRNSNTSSNEYQYFDPTDPSNTAKFRPNYYVNFATGESYQSHGVFEGVIDAASGTLGNLSLKSGGYIQLPSNWGGSGVTGRIDANGITLGSNTYGTQQIRWDHGLGYYSTIYSDRNSARLQLLSSAGVDVNNTFGGGDINIGTSFWTNVNIGNSGGTINLGGNVLTGLPMTVNVFTTFSFVANTSYNLSTDVGLSIITSASDDSSVYRITHSKVANGARYTLLNATTARPRIFSTDNRSDSNIRFKPNGSSFQFMAYSFVEFIYYGGYWYLNTDWGQ